MTCTDAKDTGHKCGQEAGHPSVSSAMTGMMEGCGCGPDMAKMMAACMDAGHAEDAAKRGGAVAQREDPPGGEQECRNG